MYVSGNAEGGTGDTEWTNTVNPLAMGDVHMDVEEDVVGSEARI